MSGNSRVELSDSVKEILIPGRGTGNPDFKRVETLIIGEPSQLWNLNGEISKEIQKSD